MTKIGPLLLKLSWK